MRTDETKKRFHKFSTDLCSVFREVLMVFIVSFIFAGCNTWQADDIPNDTLKTGLDQIDTMTLADHSTAPPVTVEQAAEQVAQQVSEPNQPRKIVTLSIEQVRAAALANNLDLNIELVNPSIAQQALDEEQARFDPAVYGSTRYQRTDTVGTGDISKGQTSEVGIEKSLPVGGEIQVGVPFSDDYSSGSLAEAATSISYIQSLLRGAGTRVNTQAIRIAAHQWNMTSARTKLVAIHLLANADMLYWRLYAARKELEVRREQYKLRYCAASWSEPRTSPEIADSSIRSRRRSIRRTCRCVQVRPWQASLVLRPLGE